MNTAAVIVGSLLLSAGTAFTVVTFTTKPPPAPTDDGASIAQLRAELDRHASDNRRLQESIDELQRQLSSATAQRVEVPRVSDEQIQAALARYLAERGSAVVDAAAGGGGEDSAPTLDVGQLFLQLQDLSGDEAEALWAKAREAGKIDELVARFEEQARANPNVADAQLGVGVAYIQKLTGEGTSQSEQGILAMKADAAFDRALDIDEQHWGARFTKAMSYTFWPPVFGKGAEAVKQFETLIQQQEGSQPQPHFAQTYELLGNMYVQQGQAEKAREVWQRGGELLPGNAGLVQKLK